MITSIVGLFTLLAIGFLVIQMRREYFWLMSIGGINALFDIDDYDT